MEEIDPKGKVLDLGSAIILSIGRMHQLYSAYKQGWGKFAVRRVFHFIRNRFSGWVSKLRQRSALW